MAPCNGELLWAKNYPKFNYSNKEPVVGCDLAGIIVAVPNSSPFRLGDEVYARTNFMSRDYTIGVTEELAHRPQRLTWAESAAVPLSAQTAWQALFVQVGLGDIDTAPAKGKRILITAASGGCGGWMVQLACIAGAEVIGTCREVRGAQDRSATHNSANLPDYLDLGVVHT